MPEQGFHIYAAVVKNLRGVIYSSLPPEAFKEKLSWLRKRFRYRNLGLTPSTLERYGDEVKPYVGRLLLELREPEPALKDLIGFYEQLTDLPRPVLEAYCYASVYVSPVLVLGRECVNDLSPLAVEKVLVNRELSDKEYKLHMRIADYTVLDFYAWATSGALEALRVMAGGQDARPILEERLERIRKDKRRYWRVISDEGCEFLLYLDLLLLLARAGPSELEGILSSYGWVAPATLAIVSAVII